MNRNTKHPDRPYRRKPSTGDRTANRRGYCITASWDTNPDRPATYSTQDPRAARRIARQMAERGAYVIVEQHIQHSTWRTLYELDGTTGDHQ